MTPAELQTETYLLMAESGLRNNAGPNPTVFIMQSFCNDIALCEENGDTVRQEVLLEYANNNF